LNVLVTGDEGEVNEVLALARGWDRDFGDIGRCLFREVVLR
jgi:hypothetical protein